jgi:hypothetical protein
LTAKRAARYSRHPVTETARSPIRLPSATAAVAGLAGVLVLRLVLHWAVYVAGFEALTADEFSRVYLAAEWARRPWLSWSTAWLPFHMYLYGAVLRVWWDLVAVPRGLTIALGLVSIVLVYGLTLRLAGRRSVALVAALLVAVNPVHLWLGATPLTEMPATVLLAAALLATVVAFADGTPRVGWLLVGAAFLALANGFRFEAWMVSLVFSGWLTVVALRRLRDDRSSAGPRLAILVAAALPWLLPMAWIAGNHVQQGDPLFFLHSISDYKLAWYGEERDPLRYAVVAVKIDPLLCLLAPLGLTLAWRTGRSAPRAYVLLTVVPPLVFAALHGGRVEPPGNELRYLGPFLFPGYAALGLALVPVLGPADRPNRGWRVLVVGALVLLVARQVTVAQTAFPVDPVVEGLSLGRRVRAMRAADAALAPRPVMMELRYWQYLAAHVGANDLDRLMYDRELDPQRRTTASILRTDPVAARACLAGHDVAVVAVWSEDLVDATARLLDRPPAEEVAGYRLFFVPDDLPAAAPADCPLPLRQTP